MNDNSPLFWKISNSTLTSVVIVEVQGVAVFTSTLNEDMMMMMMMMMIGTLGCYMFCDERWDDDRDLFFMLPAA
jgi:hypothetical protein